MIALRAEYGVATSVRWHIVPDADGVALCNRLLSPIAELRVIAVTAQVDFDDGQLCPLCRSAFEDDAHGPEDASEVGAPTALGHWKTGRP